MKERAFNAKPHEVRAILAGTKTQTRRVVRKQFGSDAIVAEVAATTPEGWQVSGHSGLWWDDAGACIDDAVRCPYGQPGDRLWVRETWMDLLCTGIEHYNQNKERTRYAYRADTPPGSYGDEARKGYGLKWCPSIHMPRSASRILLEVVSVRVERLQDISEVDARSEGAEPRQVEEDDTVLEGEWREGYRMLWESINGPGSWDANPWVWVVEFKRVEGGAA